MKPVAPEERLGVSLSVEDPEPRAPKSAEVLEGMRRVVSKSLFDLRLIRSSDYRLGFLFVEHVKESDLQVAWFRDIFLVQP